MMRRVFAVPVALATLAIAAPAQAQNLPTPPLQPNAPVAQNSAATRIAQGWVLLSAGRPEDALRIVDEVTAGGAGNHDSLALAVAAEIAQKHPDLALARYERWLKSGTPEDVYLLADIAQGVLVTLSGLSEPAVRAEATAMLEVRGVKLAAPSPVPTDATDLALARLGDAKAVDRLRASLPKLAGSQLVTALDALGASGSPLAATAIRGHLTNADPMVRASAATSLGQLKSTADLSALRQLLTDPAPWVSTSAMLALARLGDAEGRQRAEALLETGPNDLKVEIALALGPGASAKWAPKLIPLLTDDNLLLRVKAAEALARIGLNPELTQQPLAEALANPNPVLRQEATRAFLEGSLATPAQLRVFLHDPDPRVRLETSKALLRLVGR